MVETSLHPFPVSMSKVHQSSVLARHAIPDTWLLFVEVLYHVISVEANLLDDLAATGAVPPDAEGAVDHPTGRDKQHKLFHSKTIAPHDNQREQSSGECEGLTSRRRSAC